MADKVLHHSIPHLLWSSWHCFLSFPQTHHVYFHLKAFVPAVSSAWKALALVFHRYLVLSFQVISLENSICPPVTFYPIAFSVILTFISV